MADDEVGGSEKPGYVGLPAILDNLRDLLPSMFVTAGYSGREMMAIAQAIDDMRYIPDRGSREARSHRAGPEGSPPTSNDPGTVTDG